MNITTTLKSTVSWKAFSIGRTGGGPVVPKEILELFPEGATLPELEVKVFSVEEGKVSGLFSADIADLFIPALQAILGDDPKTCLHRKLVESSFSLKGRLYRLGYTHDPEEHDYGWYITAL